MGPLPVLLCPHQHHCPSGVALWCLGWAGRDEWLRMSQVVPCGDTEELEPPVPGLGPTCHTVAWGPGTVWHWLLELVSPRCCIGQWN